MHAAIVGAGLMGRWHADAAKRLGIPVVAVVDTHLARPRSWPDASASRRDVRRPRGLPRPLRRRCRPRLHTAELAHLARPACGGARLPRLVEKPLAPTLGETEAILETRATPRRESESGPPVPVSERRPPPAFPLERLGELVRSCTAPRPPAVSGAHGGASCAAGRDRPAPGLALPPLRAGIDPLAFEVLGQAEISGSPAVTEGRTSRRSSRFAGVLRATSSRSPAPARPRSQTSSMATRSSTGEPPLASASSSAVRVQRSAADCCVKRRPTGRSVQPAYPGLRELVHDFYSSLVIAALRRSPMRRLSPPRPWRRRRRRRGTRSRDEPADRRGGARDEPADRRGGVAAHSPRPGAG